MACSRHLSDIHGNDGNAEVLWEPQRHLRQCVAVTQRPMDNCWRPKSTESFGEWLALLGFLRTLRPDIGFAVKELSHRLVAPRARDFERCKRLCRYLSRTRGLGVFFPRGRGEDPDVFSLVAYSDSDWAGDRESRKSTLSGTIYLISDVVKGQSVVATSGGEAELYAAVSGMKDMILIKRALSFIGMSAKMELRLDSSAARAMLERQGAGRVRHVEVAVLWAQHWVKDRGVAVRAEPTRTNCADLGTKVHSVARFRELFDMIRLMGRDDFETEASKETLPVPLSVAVVAHSLSPLASLMTFLSTLVVHGEARVIP